MSAFERIDLEAAHPAETPPKIAIFLQDLYGGGAERMMLNLAGGIADTGVAVDLVLAQAKGSFIPMIPDSVHLVDLGVRRTLQSIPALARYLRRERPAALLAALMHVNVAAILATYLSGHCSRVVVSERSTISKESAEIAAFSIRAAHRLVPWLYPRADGITTVSQGAAEDLAQYCRLPLDRIAVINNPVVGPALIRRAAEPLDHPWFAAGTPPVVLCVGRLSPEKEFGTVIRAVAELAAQRPVRLMVLGEGVERPALEALVDELGVRDRVLLPGFVANPYAYMARAAALTLSSRWEGSPNVLVEAMALGKPVVATDCRSGPAELLEGGRYGPLVAVGDASGMAAAIGQMLDAPVPPEDLKARAGMFSVAHAAEAYLRVLLGDEWGKRQAI
jgi:glycosyltransferase involved in cell wall biosynthesis